MEELIINTIKAHPEYSHKKVAKIHGVSTFQVSQAQHAYLKSFMKRDSVKWDQYNPKSK